LASLGLHAEAVGELERSLAMVDLAERATSDTAELARMSATVAVALLQDPGTPRDLPQRALAVADAADPGGAVARAGWSALALHRAGRSADAVQILSRAETFAATSAERRHAAELRCLLHLQHTEVAAARTCALELLGPRAPSEAVATLHRDPDAEAYWGATLSAVVPGLGQWTDGEFSSGTAAFSVNGGLIAGTVSLALDAAWVDAGLLAVAMTARYYLGNVTHGRRAWRDRALRRQREAAATLTTALIRAAAAAPAPP
jgi:hypothetical protein